MTECERAGACRLAMVTAAVLLLASIRTVNAADIVGRITDSVGVPMVGTQVTVQDLDGKNIANATTDAGGRYQVRGLEPGPYNLIVRGQSGVAYLGKDGLTVNWGISKDAPPLAVARKGVAETASSTDGKRAVSPMSVESK